MFWKIFVDLCNQKSISPNKVCSVLCLSKNTATKWKNGATPRDTTLKKIADYFGVTVDYLLGKDTGSKPSLSSSTQGITIRGRDGSELHEELTDEQLALFTSLLKQIKEK